MPADDSLRERALCGVCDRLAEWEATVPMCGERPRYPICSECLTPIAEAGYAEDVELLT